MECIAAKSFDGKNSFWSHWNYLPDAFSLDVAFFHSHECLLLYIILRLVVNDELFILERTAQVAAVAAGAVLFRYVVED